MAFDLPTISAETDPWLRWSMLVDWLLDRQVQRSVWAGDHYVPVCDGWLDGCEPTPEDLDWWAEMMAGCLVILQAEPVAPSR